MELVYIWSEQYGTIKNLELNISDRFEIKHDATYNKWEISEKQYKNLYEYYCIANDIKCELSNITCIIGENGSGKTTAIKSILTRFYNSLDSVTHGSFDLPWIVIFWDGKQFLYYGNVKDVVANIQKDTKYRAVDRSKTVFPMIAIHYTSAFNYYDYMNSDYKTIENKFYDLSLSNNLRNKDDNLSRDNIISAHYRDTEFQLRALLHNDKFPIKLSRIFFIPMCNDNVIVENMLSRLMKCGRFLGEEKCKKIVGLWDKCKSTNMSITQNIMKLILFSLFNFLSYSMDKRNISESNHIIKTIMFMQRYMQIDDYNFFSVELREFIKSTCSHDSDNLVSIYDQCISYLMDNVNNYYNGKFCIPISDYDKITQYFSSYVYITKYCGEFMNYSWGMSTGEYARFNLLANLSYCSKIEDDKPLLLILDEVDLYMHPRWQQGFIKQLISDLSEMFAGKEIQIIFTTHSPIFLSDMTSSNVIYCKKDNETSQVKFEKNYELKTFGENIYNLYRNSFFMNEDKMGVLGDISKFIIQDLLKRIGQRINRNEFSKKFYMECRKIADFIAEPYVKNIILQKLERTYNQINGHYTYNSYEELEVFEKFCKLSFEEKKELLDKYKEE